MRRFMQTFVLAPQTPKKFYVHNDIFRYQDEVYQDNSDTESEDPQQSETINKNQTTTGMNYYQGNKFYRRISAFVSLLLLNLAFDL